MEKMASNGSTEALRFWLRSKTTPIDNSERNEGWHGKRQRGKNQRSPPQGDQGGKPERGESISSKLYVYEKGNHRREGGWTKTRQKIEEGVGASIRIKSVRSLKTGGRETGTPATTKRKTLNWKGSNTASRRVRGGGRGGIAVLFKEKKKIPQKRLVPLSHLKTS